MSEIEDDTGFYEMVNLFPADTGLPMAVWASERGRPAGQPAGQTRWLKADRGLKAHRHDVRVKVCETHGTRMLPGNPATVAVRPPFDYRSGPRFVAGQLSAADPRAVSDWIRLNEAALVDYWEYRISGIEFGRRIWRLP
jgi:hypothetical protein